MPMSPLPNSAVSLVPPPELIESVMVVVVPLSSPQAARKAATAVVLPPTARNRRRETGSLSCLISAIGRVPPGRLLAPTYGGCAPGGSESAQWPELHQLLYPADGQVDAVRNWDRGIEPGARRGAAGDRLDRLHPVRGRPGDDPLRRGRHLWGGLPSRRLRRPGAGGGAAVAAVNLVFYAALDRLPLGIAVTLEFVGPLGVAIVASHRRRDLAWALL